MGILNRISILFQSKALHVVNDAEEVGCLSGEDLRVFSLVRQVCGRLLNQGMSENKYLSSGPWAAPPFQGSLGAALGMPE